MQEEEGEGEREEEGEGEGEGGGGGSCVIRPILYFSICCMVHWCQVSIDTATCDSILGVSPNYFFQNNITMTFWEEGG